LRESAGLLLEDISAETKVSVRVLKALEDGAFQYLPERVFSRNFVRQYARIIGFDEERLTGWFDAAWERFLSDSGTHPTVLVVPKAPRRTFRWWVWLPLSLIGVVILIAGVAIWHQRSARTFGKVSRANEKVQRSQSAATRPVPRATAAVREATPQPSEEGRAVTFSLHVKPGRECWIRYRDVNGKYAQQLLLEGQDVRIHAPAPITLTLGNAAGVILSVGKKTYEDLGDPGEVLNLEISGRGEMKVLRTTAQNE